MSVMAIAMIPGVASAHVVVTPKQAAVGDHVLFSISVPNEKEVAVSSVKLAIPAGLENVQPNVLAGWDISTTTDNDTVTSITWTGTIPAGQRADLIFKAQAPAKASELDWKAYQTYADGTAVSWDQKPVSNPADDDSSNTGPYSVTNVVNDLGSTTKTDSNNLSIFSIILSIFAVLLSVAAILIRKRK